MSDIKDRYHSRCVRLIPDVQDVVRYRPNRFSEMIGSTGVEAVGATKTLIHNQKPSETFQNLAVEGRLDLTVEAIIVEEREWRDIFTEDDRNAARERLTKYGYSVRTRP